MNSFLVFVALFFFICNNCFSGNIKKNFDSTVLIQSGRPYSEGTGISIVKKTKDNKEVTIIFTAAHVVKESVFHERLATKILSKNNDLQSRDIFHNVIIKLKRENINEFYNAEFLAYEENYILGIDLACLIVTQKIENLSSFEIETKKEPDVGIKIYHIGNFKGEKGYRSYTEGFLSKKKYKTKYGYYDKLVMPILGGSSGGGVFDKETDRCIGLIVLSYGNNFSLMMSSKKIINWAEKNNLSWVFNQKEKAPNSKDIKILKVIDYNDYDESMRIIRNYINLNN